MWLNRVTLNRILFDKIQLHWGGKVGFDLIGLDFLSCELISPFYSWWVCLPVKFHSWIILWVTVFHSCLALAPVHKKWAKRRSSHLQGAVVVIKLGIVLCMDIWWLPQVFPVCTLFIMFGCIVLSEIHTSLKCDQLISTEGQCVIKRKNLKEKTIV